MATFTTAGTVKPAVLVRGGHAIREIGQARMGEWVDYDVSILGALGFFVTCGLRGR